MTFSNAMAHLNSGLCYRSVMLIMPMILIFCTEIRILNIQKYIT